MSNWFDRRVGEGVLRERLKALQLRNVYEFLGCYLAGAEPWRSILSVSIPAPVEI